MPDEGEHVDTSTLDLPAPVAARLRRPGWRDPRLLAGVALVAVSVALGSWVVRAAERTVPVYVARQTTVPGTAIGPEALAVADVRPGTVDLARYLRADQPLPAGAVALRVVEAGELLPASAVGSADALALRPVSVPVSGQVPEAVRTGARVDLWFSPKAASDETATPSQLAAGLTVAQVDRPQGAFAAGGTTTVHVLVPTDQLPQILGALATSGRVDVVAVPGS
jgi:hypothetical protein